MRVDQEEMDMAAWVEQQATEASAQLEYVSLQESIVRKAWAGWEEGMRLTHRQQAIGEAAARMQTTSERGDATWGRWAMSRENAWMRESSGQMPEKEKCLYLAENKLETINAQERQNHIGKKTRRTPCEDHERNF